ncbi:hypothetical protein EHQ27_05905 [Leptospira wolffii]|uniref:Imm63 family immunity protein n=1 Tax=Leptospira wolffii TaxID=409998 RepID=UPI0010826FC3|nr:Imm63 family immunity protein [Leptospira wolffii]TGK61513.1 hypothetical protein EHQ32_01230 [Leptospira wolffii]TGK70057.1 hypothetical protein EHQ35_16645 [Leptospira wolffii]TGK74988.1 hypothetical protein EHQ27_05905 [Leptospira wolffii]TGL31168.1 hypothetical protein EHQ57_07165 [Leptospira wolffii]
MTAHENDILPLEEIKKIILKKKRIIKADNKDLPSFGYSKDFGIPHLEADGGYHFVVVEKGKELKRLSTKDLDEFLYWVFRYISLKMAIRYELENREANLDSRRKRFAEQRRILTLLNLDWEGKIQEEQNQILKENPYDDFSNLRVDFFVELNKNLSDELAWAKACDKFPLPKSTE